MKGAGGSVVSRSLMIGALDLPPDFPAAEFDSAEFEFRARTGTSPITPAATWKEFSAAWTAVAYRFLDAAYFDEQFRSSIAEVGSAPPLSERHSQERYLFGFFVSGLSAIESFCYGLCSIAWEAHPSKVSLASPGQRKGVSPASTLDRFTAHFPTHDVTRDLGAVVASTDYREWVDIRNALAHRTSPPRKHHVHLGTNVPVPLLSEWGAVTLDEHLTAGRRQWLRDILATLLTGAGRFASDNF